MDDVIEILKTGEWFDWDKIAEYMRRQPGVQSAR